MDRGRKISHCMKDTESNKDNNCAEFAVKNKAIVKLSGGNRRFMYI